MFLADFAGDMALHGICADIAVLQIAVVGVPWVGRANPGKVATARLLTAQ